MPIEPGLISELRHVVVEADTAASYASGLVPTLSTPHLIALMENAARAAVEPGLLSEQSTVGVRVDMQHLAPTPVGMEVRVQARLVAVEGRRLRFHVDAWDTVEKIGTCEHERFVIDWDRFLARVQEKQR